MVIPVISSYVLQSLPAFVRNEIGETALRQANHAAGLDTELIESRNCFIPQQAVVSFVDAVARAAGDANLGLLLAPAMDVGRYGKFGRYILGAETLACALERSTEVIAYHSTYDRLSVTTRGDKVQYSYAFALSGADGYRTVACAAAGELLSVFRAYLGDDWRPLRVELDIDRPHDAHLFEDVFRCPVIFGTPAVAIVVAKHHLSASSDRGMQPIVTVEDVMRDRPRGAPRDLLDIAVEQIRAQVLAGTVLIENVARAMDTSVRTLQRELNRAGADFRSLATAARIQRASELLRHTDGSVTRVAAELGYASPAGFARAFRKATGFQPREFRKNTGT